MTLHSWLGGEAHPYQHSAQSIEPPTRGLLTHLWMKGLQTTEDQTSGENQWKNTTLCIVFQNIGGFQKEEEMELKLESIWRLTTEWNIDIMGFTESNTCWDLLPDNQHLPQCTRGWWETCQWSLAYNWREENQSSHQPGALAFCVSTRWLIKPNALVMIL